MALRDIADLSPSSSAMGMQQGTQVSQQMAQAELDRQRIARQQAAANPQGDGFTSIFDRFWTDDFSAIPGIGPAASAAATGLTNFYNDVNQAYAYTTAGLMGTPISTDLAREVTPGQIVDAKLRGIDITNDAARQSNWGPSNINVLDEDFSVNWASGVIDTTVAWFLDPLVLLGKGAKVLRVGSNFGRAGRLLERATGMDPMTVSVQGVFSKKANISGPKVVEMAQSQVDAAFMGAENRAAVLADEVVAGDFDSLRGLYEFEGAQRDLLAQVGGAITNRDDALTFIGASIGSPKYIERLQKTRSDLFVEMLRASSPSEYERLALAVGESKLPALFDRALERSVNVDDLVGKMRARDPELDNALRAVEDSERISALDQAQNLIDDFNNPIQQWGVNNAKAARIAAAWRRGKTQRVTGKNRRERARMASAVDEALQDGKIGLEEAEILKDVGRTGTRPLMYESVYTVSSLLPKVRVWTWMTGSRAAGLIDVRGMEVGQSSNELKAALSDASSLRNDPEFTARMMDMWGSALGAKDRFGAVKQIEFSSFREMYRKEIVARNSAKLEEARKLFKRGKIDTEEYNLRLKQYALDLDPENLPSKELMEEAYRLIDARRSDVIEKVQSGRAYLVDENGDLVRTDPRLRTQLETKVPMLDFAKLQQTAKILARFSDEVDPVAAGFGQFRRRESVATLQGGLDTALSLWKAGVLLRLGYTQRNVLEGWLRSIASIGITPMVARIPAWSANFSMNTYRRLGWRQRDRLAKMEEEKIKEITEFHKGIDEMLARGADETSPEVIAQRQLVAQQREALERIRVEREKLSVRNRADTKRVVNGMEFSAFGGPEGAVMRQLTGMSDTNRQFLESSLMREQDLILSANRYVKVDPSKPQYWDELNQSVVQFQSDPVAQRIIAARAAGSKDPIGDVVDWARSQDAAFWRRDMRIGIREVEGAVVDVDNMVTRYLPTAEAIDLANRVDSPGGLALREAIETYLDPATQLSAIHGREARQVLSGGQTIGAMARKPIDIVFKYIGDLPETTLVRHPYFATVWSREFDSMVAIAQRQGRDLTEDLLNSIDRSAKARALRNLKDTLYTIERLSNPAAFFRFVVPFFPAWENSIKSWGRMIMNDPSIAARASILWNIPNQLGMVVDAEGRPVGVDKMDFLTGSTDKFIRLPAGMNKWLMENVTSGIPVAIPQGAINVVTPGETPFLPGFGPIVQVPVGQFLGSKPDTQRILRDNLPPEIYNQIAPFGEVASPGDALFPSAVRKAYQLLQGEDNEMYLGIADAMMKSAFVDWYTNGANPAEVPQVDVIMEQTQQFQVFSIIASLTLPFAITRNSKYQIQEDYWRQLMADPNMTYSQKADMFLNKFGAEFAPMIESTSQKAAPMIGNTIESYDVFNDNRGLTEVVAGFNPKAVGVLLSGTASGEFDQGVYKFWGENKVPGTVEKFRRRRTPKEMQEELIMGQAWREYRAMKDQRDAALQYMGVSYTSNAASDVRAQWQYFTDVTMREKYGDIWAVNYAEYNDLTPSYVIAIETALGDEKFMQGRGSSPLWQQVAGYMEMRRMALEAIAAGANTADVREQFAAWAAQYRLSSLEFSDFYDNFLENDELINYGEPSYL